MSTVCKWPELSFTADITKLIELNQSRRDWYQSTANSIGIQKSINLSKITVVWNVNNCDNWSVSIIGRRLKLCIWHGPFIDEQVKLIQLYPTETKLVQVNWKLNQHSKKYKYVNKIWTIALISHFLLSASDCIQMSGLEIEMHNITYDRDETGTNRLQMQYEFEKGEICL